MGNNKSKPLLSCCEEKSTIFDNPLYSIDDETKDICTICNERHNAVKILRCKHNICKTCFKFEFYVKDGLYCPICQVKII